MLSGACIAAGNLRRPSRQQDYGKAMSMNTGSDQFFDVIVIGCGISGLSSAVSANSAGARVLVLERATQEEFGGNTRWTESYFRMKSEDEVSDDFEELLVSYAVFCLKKKILHHLAWT